MAGDRPRGKYATTPGGLVRKVAYLPPDVAEELRETAHQLRLRESELIREAVKKHLRRLREGKNKR